MATALVDMLQKPMSQPRISDLPLDWLSEGGFSALEAIRDYAHSRVAVEKNEGLRKNMQADLEMLSLLLDYRSSLEMTVATFKKMSAEELNKVYKPSNNIQIFYNKVKWWNEEHAKRTQKRIYTVSGKIISLVSPAVGAGVGAGAGAPSLETVPRTFPAEFLAAAPAQMLAAAPAQQMLAAAPQQAKRDLRVKLPKVKAADALPRQKEVPVQRAVGLAGKPGVAVKPMAVPVAMGAPMQAVFPAQQVPQGAAAARQLQVPQEQVKPQRQLSDFEKAAMELKALREKKALKISVDPLPPFDSKPLNLQAGVPGFPPSQPLGVGAGAAGLPASVMFQGGMGLMGLAAKRAAQAKKEEATPGQEQPKAANTAGKRKSAEKGNNDVKERGAKRRRKDS